MAAIRFSSAAASVVAVLMLAGNPPAQAQPAQGLVPPAADAAASSAPNGQGGEQAVAAELALQRGDCRAASEDYAAASVGASAATARRAAEVAFNCENPQAAWTAAQNWLKAAPADREAAVVYATAALQLYHVPEARNAVATALKAGAPISDPDLIGFIQVFSEQADATSTFAALGTLLDRPQDSALLLTALAQLAVQSYDFKRADQLVHEALQRNPKSPEALRLLARLAVLRGDAATAIATAREVMRVDVTDGTFELAEILADLDRPAEARKELERLRAGGDIMPQEIDRRLALLAFDDGDMQEAQKRFSDLVSHGEAGDGALFYLAQIAQNTGDKEAALGMYRRLLDSSMGMDARIQAAGLLLDEGKRAEAFSLLDEAAGHGSKGTFDLMLDKAHLLADHGDIDSALALLAAGLQSYPHHPTLEYEQATMLERAGQTRESLRAFEQLLAERPQDPTIQNALGYTLADHHQQLPRAEKLIREALVSTPDNPAALDSLGWVRLRRGEPREAAGILQHAYAVGQDPDIAAHWGEALWVSGSQAQARKVWNEALARHPDSALLEATLHRLAPSSGHR